jgi:hypothetical protein
MQPNLADLQRKKLLALIEASDRTAASVGHELGDKDYLRDFFKGRKNSLKPEAILKLERIFRLKAGSLMDKKFLSNEDVGPQDAAHVEGPAPNVSLETVRTAVEEAIDLARSLWVPAGIPEDEREGVIRLAIARASNRLALAPRQSSNQEKRPAKAEPSSP